MTTYSLADELLNYESLHKNSDQGNMLLVANYSIDTEFARVKIPEYKGVKRAKAAL